MPARPRKYPVPRPPFIWCERVCGAFLFITPALKQIISCKHQNNMISLWKHSSMKRSPITAPKKDETCVTSAAEETVQFADDTLRGENNVSTTGKWRRAPRQALFTRIRTFLKPAHFSPRFVWTGPITLGKKNAVSVSVLTGFVWTGPQLDLYVSRYPNPYYSYQWNPEGKTLRCRSLPIQNFVNLNCFFII